MFFFLTGNIKSWLKKAGDELKGGDAIAEIETDKAVVTYDTVDDGFLAKVLIPAGTNDVAVGRPICITVESKEDIAAFDTYVPAAAPAAVAAAAPVAAPAPVVPTPAPAPAAPVAVAPGACVQWAQKAPDVASPTNAPPFVNCSAPCPRCCRACPCCPAPCTSSSCTRGALPCRCRRARILRL